MTQHPPGARAPRVVVGVDGSDASDQALLFAAGEAQLRGAVLHIVAAHDLSTVAYGSAGAFSAALEMGPLKDALREAAEAVVKHAADTVGDLAGPALHVLSTVSPGRPSRVLLDAALDAALLVVGARGAGALQRLMTGSTCTEVVHHARMPVAVVPCHDGSLTP